MHQWSERLYFGARLERGGGGAGTTSFQFSSRRQQKILKQLRGNRCFFNICFQFQEPLPPPLAVIFETSFPLFLLYLILNRTKKFQFQEPLPPLAVIFETSFPLFLLYLILNRTKKLVLISGFQNIYQYLRLDISGVILIYTWDTFYWDTLYNIPVT